MANVEFTVMEHLNVAVDIFLIADYKIFKEALFVNDTKLKQKEKQINQHNSKTKLYISRKIPKEIQEHGCTFLFCVYDSLEWSGTIWQHGKGDRKQHLFS